MAVVERKMGLLENIVRLRRAQRRAPRDRDIATVRAELERELGATVSRRLAARFLGVSHTALARWVASGDVPTVFSIEGRQEIPVQALLSLFEAVERERKQGQDGLHVLERALREGQVRAGRIDSDDPALDAASGQMRADRRSLAYHRIVAGRLDRAIVEEALHNVWKWRDHGRMDPHYAEAWEAILMRPIPQIQKLISQDDFRGRELRQSSPLAGALSEPERMKILELVR